MSEDVRSTARDLQEVRNALRSWERVRTPHFPGCSENPHHVSLAGGCVDEEAPGAAAPWGEGAVAGRPGASGSTPVWVVAGLLWTGHPQTPGGHRQSDSGRWWGPRPPGRPGGGVTDHLPTSASSRVKLGQRLAPGAVGVDARVLGPEPVATRARETVEDTVSSSWWMWRGEAGCWAGCRAGGQGGGRAGCPWSGRPVGASNLS